MKPGKPLKRKRPLRGPSQPLARRTALARGNGALERSKGLERVSARRKATIPRAVRAAVKARSRGRCIVHPEHRGAHLHHVLPEQRFPELALEPANLVLVCELCHGRHELAFLRIPVGRLPACTLDLVARLGDPYLVYFERTYRELDGHRREA